MKKSCKSIKNRHNSIEKVAKKERKGMSQKIHQKQQINTKLCSISKLNQGNKNLNHEINFHTHKNGQL